MSRTGWTLWALSLCVMILAPGVAVFIPGCHGPVETRPTPTPTASPRVPLLSLRDACYLVTGGSYRCRFDNCFHLPELIGGCDHWQPSPNPPTDTPTPTATPTVESGAFALYAECLSAGAGRAACAHDNCAHLSVPAPGCRQYEAFRDAADNCQTFCYGAGGSCPTCTPTNTPTSTPTSECVRDKAWSGEKARQCEETCRGFGDAMIAGDGDCICFWYDQ